MPNQIEISFLLTSTLSNKCPGSGISCSTDESNKVYTRKWEVLQEERGGKKNHKYKPGLCMISYSHNFTLLCCASKIFNFLLIPVAVPIAVSKCGLILLRRLWGGYFEYLWFSPGQDCFSHCFMNVMLAPSLNTSHSWSFSLFLEAVELHLDLDFILLQYSSYPQLWLPTLSNLYKMKYLYLPNFFFLDLVWFNWSPAICSLILYREKAM